MDTEIFDVLVKETGRSKAELHDWAKSENELNEICTAEEIAGPILFLASDASSFISGVHIPIAGAAQVQAHATRFKQVAFQVMDVSWQENITGERLETYFHH